MNWVILQPHGLIAAHEKQLLIDAVLLMLTIVIPVILLTIGIIIRYRRSNTKAKYSPEWAHGTLLEAGWWLIPCIIIAVLATITWRSSHALDPYRPLNSKEKPLAIQVVALNWRWLFIYPEEQIATINFIEFPVNRPIAFYITADAPMNSFQIPALGGQIYAMPGMRTQLHLIANKAGNYRGSSVNFSGDGFANMRFTARATSPEEFDAWLKTVKQSPNQLTDASYPALMANSMDSTIYYFSSVNSGLFDHIIMKFMMPMK